MKKNVLLSALLLVASSSISAQEKSGDNLNNYVRSSLFTIILDDHGLMDKEKSTIIKENFFGTPIPEKFNDHNLDLKHRSFDPAKITVTDQEVLLYTGEEKKKKGGFGKIMKSVAGELSGGVVDTTDTKQLPAKFMKYFNENKIGNLMVAKWYDASDAYDSQSSSFFNMEMIKQRGLYNATEFDKSFAEKSTRGMSLLADAGENLVKNTFVVGIRFNYVSKEEIAQQLKKTTGAITGLIGGSAAALTNAAVQTGADIAGKGYVIKATAFLFQLDWDADASDNFYTNFYNASNLTDFYNSDAFKLKYVGSATQWADIQSTAFSKASENELVERAAVRSVDAVIAKLQKEFEVFRTKAPLVSSNPEITAYVGMKEGVESGDKFEVLEKEIDSNTGITKYNRIAVIKAEKGQIWDNRFAADEDGKEGEDVTSTLNYTTFKGNSKNLYPGLLIRQIN